MSEDNEEKKMVDLVCRNCYGRGIHANAYEQWDFEDQKSIYEPGEEWICDKCGSTLISEFALPRKVWNAANPEEPGSTEDLMDYIMSNMAENVGKEDQRTLFKFLELAYLAAAKLEGIPYEEVKKNLNTAKVFLAL